MKTLSSVDFRNVILLTLAAILAMLLFGQLPNTVDYTTLRDSSWYLRTAEAAPNLDPGQRQPFAFRLLGPYLIGLLPIAAPLGFRIVTIILTFCLGISSLITCFGTRDFPRSCHSSRWCSFSLTDTFSSGLFGAFF